MTKEQCKQHTVKWGKRFAFFAVFGFTGIAAIGAVKLYRKITENTEIDWDV